MRSLEFLSNRQSVQEVLDSADQEPAAGDEGLSTLLLAALSHVNQRSCTHTSTVHTPQGYNIQFVQMLLKRTSGRI